MMDYTCRHFQIGCYKPTSRLDVLSFRNTYINRYNYGDVKEHIIGITLCNFFINIIWKSKDDDDWDLDLGC